MGYKIFLSPPHMGDLERNYLLEAFDSNWIAPVGKNIDLFEEETSHYVNRKYALAVNSGTSALHLSLISLVDELMQHSRTLESHSAICFATERYAEPGIDSTGRTCTSFL